MQKKILFKILVVVAVFTLGLTSCNLMGYIQKNDADPHPLQCCQVPR